MKRNSTTQRPSGDIVVFSCGAINSAALLLRSANDKHPRGLASCSDVVGRHYMGHINSVLMAVSRCPDPTIVQKTLAVNDVYFGAGDFPYPMGHISFVGTFDGVTLSAGAPAIAPGFTLDLMARHISCNTRRGARCTAAAATTGFSRAACSSGSGFRSQASRIRTVRCASVTIRRRRRST